ncbi:MAG TPA: hypothetical protein ENJ53_01020 [Phaeodactylibacter sp.]|nr:hypothetical protein [Phaeodactylibacter sp.]
MNSQEFRIFFEKKILKQFVFRRPEILKDKIFDKIFHTAELANYTKMEKIQYQDLLLFSK